MTDKKSKTSKGDFAELQARIVQLEGDLKSLSEKVVEHTASFLIDGEEQRRDVVSMEKRLNDVEQRTHEHAPKTLLSAHLLSHRHKSGT